MSALVRVAHPEQSLWQSAVREVVADRLAGGDLTSPLVSGHALAQAVDLDVASSDSRLERIFDLAREAAGTGLVPELEAIRSVIQPYSDRDPVMLIASILKFVEWYGLGRQPEYRDWTVAGRGDIDYGVVDFRLPPDARVALIADWGTGLADARSLFAHVLRELRPTVIVHLGDIYYSGTARECAQHFGDVVDAAFRAAPPRLPVFTLPGNHDYYSGGRGFYGLLDRLRAGQPASYLCLRSADSRWQFLGVDTGSGDHTPGIVFNPFGQSPRLHGSEVEWLRDKLRRFAGRTILLSHHQVFSAHAMLNGPESGRPVANFNDVLHAAAGPFLDRVAAWFWGHEHSLGIFEDGLHGIARGRLIGCSGFEMETADGPYTVHFADVRYRQPPIRLPVRGEWYDHGLAVIDLGTSSIEYHAFPSWSGPEPVPAPSLQLLYREPLGG